MTSDTRVVPLRQPDQVDDPLTAVLRNGARRLLAQAVEAEAEAFLAEMRGLRLPSDSREERHVAGRGRVPQRRLRSQDYQEEAQRRTSMPRPFAVALGAACIALAAPARAHVTLDSPQAPALSYVRLAIRVPH